MSIKNEIVLEDTTLSGELKHKMNEDVFEWIDAFIFAFIVVCLLFGFILQKAEVDGPSMIPTLEDREQLLAYKFIYFPKRGDVIIIDPEDFKPIVKRVIGVPGDEINIDYETGKTFVNGKEIDESYLAEIMLKPTLPSEDFLSLPLVLGEKEYFVMGDNRNNSMDSRHINIGVIKKDEILGKVIVRYLPLNRAGIIK